MPDAIRDLSCVRDFKNSVVNQLIALNVDGLGSNIFANRVSKIWPDEETVCIVNIPNVEFADNRSSPRFYIARGDMNIDVYSRTIDADYDHTNSADDACEISDFIDSVSQEIIEYLETHIQAGKDQLMNRFFLKSMSNNLSETEAVRGTCRIVFGFEMSVVINWNAPTDEFLTAKNTLTMGEGSGNRQDFDTNVRP